MRSLYFESTVVVIVFSAFFSLQSCQLKSVEGNGNVAARQIEVTDFNAIEVEGSLQLEYEQQTDSAASLQIEIDENLFQHLDISVSNRILHIAPKGGTHLLYTTFKAIAHSPEIKKLDAHGELTATLKGGVNARELKFNVEGATTLVCEDLRCDRLETDVSGEAQITLHGMVQDAKYTVNGSAKVFAYHLSSQKTECKINGEAEMQVNIIDQLDVDISGNGNVTYIGNPHTFNQKIAGAGSVSKKE